MYRNRIEGNWKQLKGKMREKWGELTDDQLDVMNGRREQLAGKLQEVYSISRDEADQLINDFAASLHDYENESEVYHEVPVKARRRY
jgi:uncharacterized protein YjbJ (UPF0337 family)